jgi:hypothetical protein
MSVAMVLSPVFVLVALTFASFFGIGSRVGTRQDGQALLASDPAWLPVLFYVLVALALPLRHADLVFVLLSWVFVVTRLLQAGILMASGDERRQSLISIASILVLFALWLYFALRILLGI